MEVERTVVSGDVEIAVIDKQMSVERVIKLRAEYEVESLVQLCVLGYGKVHVFVVRPSEAKYARTFTRVSKHACAAPARPGRLKGS